MNTTPTPPANRTPSGRAALWLGVGVVLVGMVLSGLWPAPQRIHHDCALYLQQAEMLLDGAVPYCDFVDTNPPLIVYLNVLPVALARAVGISPILAFHGLVIALLFVSELELYLLLRSRRLGLPAPGNALVLLAWIALYFVVEWRGDTGQREHLFVLFYIPYLFLRILRHRGGSVAGWFAVLLGVQAGIGLALKPHFFLAALGVEIILLLSTRRWRTLVRPENFALVGFVTAYLAHWLFVPAAMREAFFGRWLPLVAYGYRAYNASFRDVVDSILGSPVSLAALAAALLATLLCQRPRVRLRHHLAAMAAFCGMGLLLIFVQHKGWSYHRVPLDAAGLLCVAILVAVGIGRTARVRQWAAGGLVVGVLVGGWVVRQTDFQADPPEYAALRQIVERRTEPGDRVLVVATSVRPAYPMLLQTGRKPGSRYLCAFPIALAYADAPTDVDKRSAVPPTTGSRPLYRRRNEAPVEEQRFLDELQDDVGRLRPRLIIVQASAGWIGLPEGFNTFDYLVYSGWAQAALPPYRGLPGPEGWKVFERSP